MKKYFTNIKSSFALMALGLTTLVSSAHAQSYTEDFSVLANLTDWLVLNNSNVTTPGAGNNWGGGNPTVFPAQAGPTNSYLTATANSSNVSGATGVTLSNWLFTPTRTFSNGDVITFYTRTATPVYADRLEVRLGTDGSGTNVGTTPTSVGEYSNLLLSINPTLNITAYPTTWTQYTITIAGLAAPTTTRIAFRYFVTDGGPTGNNSNYIGIDTYTYTAAGTPPANDNCAGAFPLTPGAACTPVSGNVNFATQSQAACGDGTANDDVWYKFTATTTGANISVDGSIGFDGVFEVFSGACTGLTSIACIDNTAADGIEATTVTGLTVGQTYYIRIFDWYNRVPATTGFTICVQEFVPCDLTQPAGSVLEAEACGQDLNGGCNMTTPAYQTLTCGQTVFGSAWASADNKDTDWYKFTIVEPGTATFTAKAEFPFTIFFLNIANCASPAALASASSLACENATITYNFTTPGTYVAFISPSVFSGYACGGTSNDYFATLTLPSTTPVVSATTSTTVCTGESVALSATGTGAFQWFNGTTPVGTNAATYAATASGSYTAKLTNGNGCLGPVSNAINVTVNPMDNAVFAYTSNTICNGSANVTPTVSTPGTFSSTPAGLIFVSATTGEINVATSTLGTYTVTYTTAGPCTNTTTQTLTITDAPGADFSYVNASYCGGDANPSPTFDAGSSAGTFSSTTGLTINSATGEINLATSTPGTYTVTNQIAASGSCPAASSTTDVTVYARPTATVSGGGAICNPTGSTGTTTVTITLTGVAPYDFTYTDGTTPVTITAHATNTYTITTSTAGTYTVTSVSDDNCSNTGTGSATVGVFTQPVVTLTGFTPLCSNATAIVLSQGSPAGGVYSGTGVTGGNFNPSVAPTGTVITYVYTDANGCSGTATAPVTINAAPTVTLTDFASVCSNVAAFPLTGGTPAGGTYSGPGVTGGNFNPATATVGTHAVVYAYTNTAGCTGTANKTITVKNCAGIEENELGSSLVVYPNPASESVTVAFETIETVAAQISLISLDGKSVYNTTLDKANKFSQVISTENLPGGIYLIQIQTTQGSATKRLVIQ